MEWTVGDSGLIVGRRLTTAEILYRMPDHPKILQTYVWQDMDLPPQYPILKRFLDFWDRELEGKLFRVRVAHASAGYRMVDLELDLL